MAFADAMRDYGSDKPDLRVPLKLTELTDLMKGVDFKVFRAAAEMANGRVAALRVPGGSSMSRALPVRSRESSAANGCSRPLISTGAVRSTLAATAMSPACSG